MTANMSKRCSSFGYAFGFTFILGGLSLVLYVAVVYFKSGEEFQNEKGQDGMENNFARHHLVSNVIIYDTVSLSTVRNLHNQDDTVPVREHIEHMSLSKKCIKRKAIRKQTTKLWGLLDAGKNCNIPTLQSSILRRNTSRYSL